MTSKTQSLLNADSYGSVDRKEVYEAVGFGLTFTVNQDICFICKKILTDGDAFIAHKSQIHETRLIHAKCISGRCLEDNIELTEERVYHIPTVEENEASRARVEEAAESVEEARKLKWGLILGGCCIFPALMGCLI